MLKVGITGGIGSGKSTVCRIFSVLGIPIYDADSRAKWLQNNDKEIISQVITQFGKESYSDGIYNAKYIASIVFNHPEKLERLNQIVHPRILIDTQSWYEQHSKAPYTIREAALLIEAGMYKTLDKLIVVSSPEDLRISRIIKRDPQRSKEEVLSIISRQMPEKDKVAMADYVILNNEKHSLINQVMHLHTLFQH